MSDYQKAINDAKDALPLPELMKELGYPPGPTTTMRCPFHEDSDPSFSIFRGQDNRWFFKCHAGCGAGDEIDFMKLSQPQTDTKQAIDSYLNLARVKIASSRPIYRRGVDWEKCVEAIDSDIITKVAAWRGYSESFVKWLKKESLIGLHDGLIAIVVHQAAGQPGCHRRQKDGSWRYFPKGLQPTPLIIGGPDDADTIWAFESQWDAFAVMDTLGWHEGKGPSRTVIVVTRGASNGPP